MDSIRIGKVWDCTKKSYIDIVYLANIPDEYKMAWVFGYLDGDGGISIYSDSKRAGIKININFTGRDKFIIRLGNYIGYKATIQKVNEETSVLRIYTKFDAYRFMKEYIEFNNKVTVLERKIKKAEQYVEWIENQYGKQTERNTNKEAVNKVCNKCGKEFISRFNIETCVFCDRGYEYNGLHRRITDKKKYTCQICGKEFESSIDIDKCQRCRYLEKQRQEKPERFICQICGKETAGAGIHNICVECAHKKQERAELSKETLEELLKTKNFTQIGKEYGVSANAIKKRAIKYGIYEKKTSNHNRGGLKNQVLKTFLEVLNVKKTAEICSIPNWKVSEILKEYNKDYGKLIVTGEVIADSYGNYYQSMTKAAEALGDKMYMRHIKEQLDGKRASAYNRVYRKVSLREYAKYLTVGDETELGIIYRDMKDKTMT